MEFCSIVIWQPGWEESLMESWYMYLYGWVPLLFPPNYHNTVNWLYAVLCLIPQSCSTLCNSWWTVANQVPLSMRILQARILEWDAMPFSRGSSQPRNRTGVSSCLAGRFFTSWATRNAHICVCTYMHMCVHVEIYLGGCNPTEVIKRIHKIFFT